MDKLPECKSMVDTFKRNSVEKVVSLAILGAFAVLFVGMVARRACGLRRHRSCRSRSKDSSTEDALGGEDRSASGGSPSSGSAATGTVSNADDDQPQQCCSSARALASKAAIGSRTAFDLLVAAYIIIGAIWFHYPFNPILGQVRNAAFGLAMQGFFHFSVDRVKWTQRGRRSKMRALLVTCDYLVLASLYCNSVGMYSRGSPDTGVCACLANPCAIFTVATDALLAVIYVVVSCGFIGLLNKLIRRLMNTTTMSKAARRRQTGEIAKLLAVSVANILCQLARLALLAVGPVHSVVHSTSDVPTVSSALVPVVYGGLEVFPFFLFLLISTGDVSGRSSAPSAVERTLERLGYNGVEIMAQAGARRAERSVAGRPHRGWLALDVSCTELILEDRQLGIALPSLFHGKTFFLSLQVAPPPAGSSGGGGGDGAADKRADGEGGAEQSDAVRNAQQWTEVSRTDVVESPSRPVFLVGPLLSPSLRDDAPLRVSVHHTQPHRAEDAPIEEYHLAAYAVLSVGEVRALTSGMDLLDSTLAGRRSLRRSLLVTGQPRAVRVLQQAQVVLEPHVVPLWVPHCAQVLAPTAIVAHPSARGGTLSGPLAPQRRGGSPDGADSPRAASGALVRLAAQPQGGAAAADASAPATSMEGDLVGAVIARSFCLRLSGGEESAGASYRASTARSRRVQRQGSLLHRLAGAAGEGQEGGTAGSSQGAASRRGQGVAWSGAAATVMAVEQVQEAAEALPVACSALQAFAAERYRVAETMEGLPQLRAKHMSTARDYERKVQGLWALLRRGRLFKRSTEKKDDLLSHVATNLHVQRVGAPDRAQEDGHVPTASDLIIVTVGIPSAHFLGVKTGGLAHRLQEAHDQACELASLLLSRSAPTALPLGAGSTGSSPSVSGRSAAGEVGGMNPGSDARAPLLSGAALSALISSKDASVATTVDLARQELGRALGAGGAAVLWGHHRDAILLGATAIGYHAYAPIPGADSAPEGAVGRSGAQRRAKGQPATVAMTDLSPGSPVPTRTAVGGDAAASSDPAAGTPPQDCARDGDMQRRVQALQELLFGAGLRLEASLCQSVSAMVASWTRLAQMHAEGMLLNSSTGHPLDRLRPRSRAQPHYTWWEQQLRTGFLFQLESLVSTSGGESGMLSDGAIAVSELSRVTIRLVRDPRGPAAARWRQQQQRLLDMANTGRVSVQNPLSQAEEKGVVDGGRATRRLSVGAVERGSAARLKRRAATAEERPSRKQSSDNCDRSKSSLPKWSSARGRGGGGVSSEPYAVPPTAAEEAESSLARNGSLPDPFIPLVRFLCVSLEPVAACGHVAPQWRRRYLGETAASAYGGMPDQAEGPAPGEGAGAGQDDARPTSPRERPRSWRRSASTDRPKSAPWAASRPQESGQGSSRPAVGRDDAARLASALRQVVVTVAVEPTVFDAVQGIAPAPSDFAVPPPPDYAGGTRTAEGFARVGRGFSHRRQRLQRTWSGEVARDGGADEEEGEDEGAGKNRGAPPSSPLDLTPQLALAGVDVDDALFVDVTGVLFSQGINEAQTVANSRNSKDLSLQDDVNVTSALALHEYTEHYLRTSGQKRSERTITALHDMLSRLDKQVEAQFESRRRKRVELLQLAADIVRALRGGRATSCKSAKDRTSMSVTLEQGRVLQERYGLASEGMQELVDAMRMWGVRRENARNNVGKPRFAFNRVQLQLFPREYRPPLQTIGGVVT